MKEDLKLLNYYPIFTPRKPSKFEIQKFYRLTWNIDFNKYSERSFPWMKNEAAAPVYEEVPVERYKYKKPIIFKMKP